ncbi:hypothetical protein Tco_0884589 [Tanacetum coccineum]
MDKSHSYLTHDKYQDLFDSLLKSIMLDEAIERGGDANLEESVAKPSKEVIIDVEDNTVNDDVVNDANQPQDDSVPKTDIASKINWFKQPPMPPTPDPEWNKFAMNRLKIDKLKKEDLAGPVYELLNGTCQSSIELKYNMEECYFQLDNQWFEVGADLL